MTFSYTWAQGLFIGIHLVLFLIPVFFVEVWSSPQARSLRNTIGEPLLWKASHVPHLNPTDSIDSSYYNTARSCSRRNNKALPPLIIPDLHARVLSRLPHQLPARPPRVSFLPLLWSIVQGLTEVVFPLPRFHQDASTAFFISLLEWKWANK